MLRHINFFIMCVRSCISLIVYLLLQCIKLAKREMFDWKIISIYVQDLYLFRSHDYLSFNWLIAYVPLVTIFPILNYLGSALPLRTCSLP